MEKITRSSSPDMLSDIFGGPEDFSDIVRDPKSEAYATFLLKIRTTIASMMHDQGMRSADIARKMNVSKSVISRIMNPDCDLYASTMFEIAWALESSWSLSLSNKIEPIVYFESDTTDELRILPFEVYTLSEDYEFDTNDNSFLQVNFEKIA